MEVEPAIYKADLIGPWKRRGDWMKRMKSRSRKALIGWATGLLIVLVCCNGWAFAGNTKTVVDSTGRRVTFNFPVKRIIVTDDTVADPVRIFGKQKLVVGVENSIAHRGYFKELSKQPTIGNQWGNLNWELIVSLKPDIILMADAPAVTPKVTAMAERLKIPILVLRWRFADSMDQTARLLGEVFGESKRARQFIKWRHDCLGLIAKRLKGLSPGKRIAAYVEADISGPIGRAAGKGMPADETLRLAGLSNICRFRFSKEVSSEWIMARNPHIIFMNDYGGAGEITGYLVKDKDRLKKYLERIRRRKKFKKTKAVEKDNVYVMNAKLCGSMHMVGALYLAKSAYPRLLKDVDPREVHREFFERWMGIPYRGIWFFPTPRNN